MKLILALLLGKLISYLSQTLKVGGGSSAPGLYALKIDPDLIEKLIRKIPQNIIITGTNGKTTTSRMISHFATSQGLKVIRNHTGSNLERGIASTLISSYTLYPKPSTLGVWELDEAAFNSVASKIKPDVIVFLNVFRDQLDRYGEIDSVVKNWCETLKKLPKETTVLVNGDDHNTLKLKSCFKGKVETFGVENYKIIGESIEHQKNPISLNFEAKNVKLNGLEGIEFDLRIKNYDLRIKLPLPGIYHVYDSVASMAAVYHLFTGTLKHRLTDFQILSDALTNFQPAFGRVEKIPQGFIFLIKNPAGATQVFETIAPQLKPGDRLLIALNDNLADGTDVSWIWDAEFEQLTINDEQLTITCSGTRAYDLAVRLKYAGFNPKSITVEPNLKKAFQEAQRGLKGTLYILPTYTAMLELQNILTKLGIKKPYWKEEKESSH